MKPLCFELCAETLEAARAGEAGGASRIELCADSWMGGVTPSTSLLEAAIKALAIPVRVLIRPRGGNFVYSAEEFDLMRRQIADAKRAGAAGVVAGVLQTDGRVDIVRSRDLAELARPMGMTFHRAFDETRDLDEALQDVMATGAECLLTSGGEADVLAGADAIARLRKMADERLDVMAGGGLRLTNLMEVVRRTGVTSLHGSLPRKATAASCAQGGGSKDIYNWKTLETDVREAVKLFHQAHEARERDTQTAR